jgi:hypothetical protein
MKVKGCSCVEQSHNTCAKIVIEITEGMKTICLKNGIKYSIKKTY